MTYYLKITHVTFIDNLLTNILTYTHEFTPLPFDVDGKMVLFTTNRKLIRFNDWNVVDKSDKSKQIRVFTKQITSHSNQQYRLFLWHTDKLQSLLLMKYLLNICQRTKRFNRKYVTMSFNYIRWIWKDNKLICPVTCTYFHRRLVAVESFS